MSPPSRGVQNLGVLVERTVPFSAAQSLAVRRERCGPWRLAEKLLYQNPKST